MKRLIVEYTKRPISDKYKNKKTLEKFQSAIFNTLNSRFFDSKDIIDNTDNNNVKVIMSEGDKKKIEDDYATLYNRGNLLQSIEEMKNKLPSWLRRKGNKTQKAIHETPYEFMRRWLMIWAFIDFNIYIEDVSNESEVTINN